MSHLAGTLLSVEDEHLYRDVANRLSRLIEKGTYPQGSRLPSIRSLSSKWKVSVSTIVEAYRVLDDEGLIEVRPKSGHFVRRKNQGVFRKPPSQLNRLAPTSVHVSDLTLMLLRDSNNPAMVQLGAGVPCPDDLPLEKLYRVSGAAARRDPKGAARYEFPPGNERLRKEIAKHSIDSGSLLSPDEVVITNGCQEAVMLSLQAICEPGDIVAIESPAYYGFLQIIETLKLKALEIPCTYPEGICLEALQFVMENHSVKACLIISSFNNPLGSNMSEEKREKLVNLAASFQVPIIEDEIYSDLAFQDTRPRSLKSFDQTGNVITCSSFSKTLAPGYRIGWVCGGNYQKRIETIKGVTTIATSSLPQMGLAAFLAEGGYSAHLRKMRRIYKEKTEWLIQAVKKHFPDGMILYPPSGGSMLWLEMPSKVDSLQVFEESVQAGITVAPGVMFSSKDRFRHCLRLNASYAAPEQEPHIKTLGQIIQKLASS